MKEGKQSRKKLCIYICFCLKFIWKFYAYILCTFIISIPHSPKDPASHPPLIFMFCKFYIYLLFVIFIYPFINQLSSISVVHVLMGIGNGKPNSWPTTKENWLFLPHEPSVAKAPELYSSWCPPEVTLGILPALISYIPVGAIICMCNSAATSKDTIW